MRFLHVADLHLDSPLRGLERYEGAPVAAIRGATRRALERLVDLALAEPVDAVLIAGDVYDGDWRDYSTGLFLAAQLARLRAAGVPVVLISGNHDAASVIARSLPLPANVRVLSVEQPETTLLEDIGLAVHGQGFATRAVAHDLSAAYPAPVPGALNVGLLHTSADGRVGHAAYAPCTLAGLTRLGYDYWALGHVHAREVVSSDPWVVFPGNLQGRHVKETGPKGATLVTVHGGRITSVEHRALDVLRWLRVGVDATAADHPDDVLELAAQALTAALGEADGRPLAVRVEAHGATPAHARLLARPEALLQALRARATDLGGGAIWIERLRVRTTPPGRPARDAADASIATLLDGVRRARRDDTAVRDLAGQLADLRGRLPIELTTGEDALDLGAPEVLLRLLADAEALVVDRVLGTAEDAA